MGQRVSLEQVLVYGPEPIGLGQTEAITARFIADANGAGNARSIARGPKGDPSRSVTADLGPLQSFTSVRTVAQPGYAKGLGGGLPSTSGGSTSIQDMLGRAGI